jgi:benzoate membrane transport protein
VLGAPLGGHAVNLAAITAALAAGPEAGPDPGRRWIASVVAAARTSPGPRRGRRHGAHRDGAADPGRGRGGPGAPRRPRLGAGHGDGVRGPPRRRGRLPGRQRLGHHLLGISAPFWGLVAGLALWAAGRRGSTRVASSRSQPEEATLVTRPR